MTEVNNRALNMNLIAVFKILPQLGGRRSGLLRCGINGFNIRESVLNPLRSIFSVKSELMRRSAEKTTSNP